MNQSVSEAGELFLKDSPFDVGTPITANLGLTAQWNHVHSYTCYQVSDFGDALAAYQKYNKALHIAVCGCNDIELVAHTFGADGTCACGYEKAEAAKVTLNISYVQWSGDTYTEKMQEFPQEVLKGQEVSVSAPHNWGILEFQKWQYSAGDGVWADLTVCEMASFLIPANMYVRALYVNPVAEPQVELSARQYDDQAEVNGQTYTMDNILFQMNYKLPDGYTFVDAGIRMGDNAGISYYELKERTQTMDAEAKAIGASVCGDVLVGWRRQHVRYIGNGKCLCGAREQRTRRDERRGAGRLHDAEQARERGEVRPHLLGGQGSDQGHERLDGHDAAAAFRPEEQSKPLHLRHRLSAL